METLKEFNDRIKDVVEAASKINDAYNKDIWEKAPVLVYQKFTEKFSEIMQDNPSKYPRDVPEAVRVSTAISVLRELYPELTKK